MKQRRYQRRYLHLLEGCNNWTKQPSQNTVLRGFKVLNIQPERKPNLRNTMIQMLTSMKKNKHNRELKDLLKILNKFVKQMPHTFPFPMTF